MIHKRSKVTASELLQEEMRDEDWELDARSLFVYEVIDWWDACTCWDCLIRRPITTEDIAIFWAVAEGDLNRVRTILEEDPSWIHAISYVRKSTTFY
jgi:hypothetical protein